jgi:2-keto-3-deoxy-6-phosphogluconate aldolase
MLIGAGTVFSLKIAKEALKNGARFIVSPHLDIGEDEKIVSYCELISKL